ncbi:hypothetical protein FHU36_008438 [Nonomuraea muscovyensis]|uniref:Uncharacterized protein n=1 Tax=Nonomuraea muscovyensis TaxID=1124761 RepID=A0A7X0CCU6_9ACTN|nr:hypothetical protein [Nonomuraea muscovyensis]MBB6351855.1 hypothetical protein [Nonomuraea muscovyensis]
MTFPRTAGCPSWCAEPHQEPGRPHFANLDLIEHLDDSDCLVEVNVRQLDGQGVVLVLFTDRDGESTRVEMSQEAAGVVGYILREFDRRGAKEFGHLLFEAAQLLEVTQ